MSAKFAVRGFAEVQHNLSNLGRAGMDAGERGLKKLADEVKKESIGRAPLLTGNLEGAHRVAKQKAGARITYTIFVDDGAAPYAVYMHEGINGGKYQLGELSQAKSGYQSYHYGKGVGWKFLERAASFVDRHYLAALANELRKGLEKATSSRSLANRLAAR